MNSFRLKGQCDGYGLYNNEHWMDINTVNGSITVILPNDMLLKLETTYHDLYKYVFDFTGHIEQTDNYNPRLIVEAYTVERI